MTARYDANNANSSPTMVTYRVNGGAWQTKTFPQITATTQVATVSIGGTDGAHRLETKLKSAVGKESATTVYQFGYGKPSTVAPVSGATSHTNVRVDMVGPPLGGATGLTGHVQWRVKGSDDAAWSAPVGATSIGTTLEGGTGSRIAGTFDMAALAGQKDKSGSGVSVSARRSTVVELRGCFNFTGLPAQCTDPVSVVRVPHAFGAGFPTAEIATGQVALWTGEFQLSATDAELATPAGGLSISRTHSTWAGAPSAVQGVFGPGWTASLDGGPTGVSEMELVDNTTVDGTLVLTSAQGDVMPFAPSNAARRAGATITAGTYMPIGADAEASELKLVVSASTGKVAVSVIDTEGISTLFTAPTPASAAASAVFAADSVTDSVTGEVTSYRYNAAGLVVAIVAPLPDGVSGECTPGAPRDGCRILKLTYTGSGAATRLASITAQVNSDPDRLLSTYTYTSGRLATQTDAVTGLTTTYGWTGSDPQPRLASLTPAGLEPFSYVYDAAGKLSKVTRPVPTSAGGGTSQLAAIVYGVAPSSIHGINLAQFEKYSLPRSASIGFAVFGPDAPINTTPTGSDEVWRRADVWLADSEGYTIHEARFGAGDWQLTANVYDVSDNLIETWDTRATAELRKGAGSAYTDVASASTSTRYNAEDIKASDGTVLVPARTRVTDIYTPAAMIKADGADAPEMLRRHVATTYDQGAPAAGLSLPTTQVVTAERLDATVAETLSTTLTGYEALTTGDKTGWELRQATSTTLDMNGNSAADAADIRREIRYDARGRIIEQRQPGATSSDPGTRVTIYWSAGMNSRDAACSNQPTWAGFICKQGPATQPVGVTVPTTTHRDYLWHGAPATQLDASGSATRTTATTFDAKARPVTVTTTASGIPGSTPLPAVTTSYDAQGRVIATTSPAGSTAMTYDTWGRQLTYTTASPTGGESSTTTAYNPLGEVASITTPKASTTYTYDGIDANGNREYRGLLTKTVTTVGTFTVSAQAAFDAQGALTLEKLPAGIQRRSHYDLTGELVTQEYWGPADGSPDPVEWLAWTTTANASGHIVSETGPEGTHITEQTPPGTSATLTYTYDPAGRLTKVQDSGQTGCTVRRYTHDKRGNRTGHSETTGPTCQAGTTPPPTKTYDAADRPTSAADGTGYYLYDALGRQLTIPAADSPNPKAGDITLGYYDDDSAATITQADRTLAYQLDVAGRRTTQTTINAGVLTDTVTNHYIDQTDSPGWITNTTTTGTATTVYTNLVNSDLTMSVITDTTGTRGELAITTPRGDIASTITIETSGATANGLDTWTRYTEYGQPITTQTTRPGGTTANGYGWLGAKQRTTTTTGLLLMGARLYNPTTGHFTSLDPIQGGNDTPYTYPTDPINKQDTTGKKGLWRTVGAAARWLTNSRFGKVLNTACGFTWGVAAAVCGGVYTAAYAAQGRWREAGKTAAMGLAGFAVGGAVARGLAKTGVVASRAIDHLARRGAGLPGSILRARRAFPAPRSRGVRLGVNIYVSTKFGTYGLYSNYRSGR